MRTIQITKYIADNGVIFDNENDCVKYEEVLKGIKYFVISYCFDSNTQEYQKHKLIMINSNGAQDAIALSVALKLTEGKTLHFGYNNRYFPAFKIKEIGIESFNNFKKLEKTDKYVAFISDERVEGFPENYNSISGLL